jgi:hypothetical protein
VKTEAGNTLQQHILDSAKKLNDTATMYAVTYAQTDSPESKASFDRYSFAAEEIRKLHAPACQMLHAIEAMIPNPKEAKKP